jgi:SAM-dependent methyltransferase
MAEQEQSRPFWGRGADDWIELQEPLQRPLYEALLDAVELGQGFALLDAGCGSGVVSLLASQRGASVTGLDASPAFVEIARLRCRVGQFSVGDLNHALPFPDNAFDGVIFSNSLQFVANSGLAVREAARVLRPGCRVAIAVFDVPEKCDGAKPIGAIFSLLPARPDGAPGPFALSNSRRLESLVRDAALELLDVRAVEVPWRYPDVDTARRAFMSAGPSHEARVHAGEQRLREVLDAATTPFRRTDGTYLLENSFLVAVGRKTE